MGNTSSCYHAPNPLLWPSSPWTSSPNSVGTNILINLSSPDMSPVPPRVSGGSTNSYISQASVSGGIIYQDPNDNGTWTPYPPQNTVVVRLPAYCANQVAQFALFGYTNMDAVPIFLRINLTVSVNVYLSPGACEWRSGYLSGSSEHLASEALTSTNFYLPAKGETISFIYTYTQTVDLTGPPLGISGSSNGTITVKIEEE